MSVTYEMRLTSIPSKYRTRLVYTCFSILFKLLQLQLFIFNTSTGTIGTGTQGSANRTSSSAPGCRLHLIRGGLHLRTGL